MHAGIQHNRLRDRMAPVGLSVLVNACLITLMAHAFMAPNGPVRRYLEVELQVPAAAIHHVTQPRVKQVVLPAPAPKPAERPRAERQAPPKPAAQSKPVMAVLGSKQEMRTTPVHSVPGLSLPQAHGEPSQGSGPGAVGMGAPGGPGVASGAGPGVYTGPGDGTSGHGSGAPSAGHGSSDGHITRPAPAHEVRPSTPEPPKPAPKGESRDARISHQSKPAYPSDAREDGVEGTVLLEVSIGTDGRVTSAKVDRSSGDRRLDRAAAEAVRQWSYEPSLKDGVPVTSSMRVRVEFRLE